MTQSFISDVKRLSLCASFLFVAACAQNSGGGGVAGSASSCIQPEDIDMAIQQSFAVAPVSGGNSLLMAQLPNLKEDFSILQADLQHEDASAKIQKINDQTVAIDIAFNSPAKSIIERFVSQKRITHIEADAETFGIQPSESRDSDDESSAQSMDLGLQPSSLATQQQAQAESGQPIIVAVIDSGVDYNHKALAPYIWKNAKEIAGNGKDDDGNGYVDDVMGWDFANNDNQPMADDVQTYHGTHVAGIVKMASKLVEKGLNIKIMALKYLNSQSAGRTSNAIRAIEYAVKNGAIILNNSWGSFSYSAALFEAIQKARQARTLFVAAAGNDGANTDRTPFYPAAYALNNIISVAAVDDQGVMAGWSNFGALNVDLGAPGVQIRSTSNNNSYKIQSGTSMAAPYVSGVAAMLWASRPDLSFAEIRKVIYSSVRKGVSLAGKTVTGGFINPSEAAQVASAYQHDPNDLGMPELAPNFCTN
ncbi:MAG: S8 family peptidase [Pseudobdellovibrionaceae bacterium]